MKNANPLEKATHMFFAEDETGVYAAGWDIPEWNTKKDFYKEHAGKSIYRIKVGTDECKKMAARFKAWPENNQQNEKGE